MIGRRIGKYTVLRKLGEGGMGAVYLGQHAQIGRRVAIKVLLPRHSHNRYLVRRFFNEARATAQIKHPGLVEVFDFGELEDGSAYLVMEWLEGETLAARIERGALGPALTAEIGRQLASAVAAAHAHGIVHRDLKPENVFLIRDPDLPHRLRVKVLDFGVAKLTRSGSAGETANEALLGTPGYISPEQCRGAGLVDHRTDIYSMGCILFEMACGCPPFPFDNPGDLITAHVDDAPPDPLTLMPDIPLALRETILRCLEKDPVCRYPDATVVGEELAPLAGLGRLPRKRHADARTTIEDTRLDPALADEIARDAGLEPPHDSEETTVRRPARPRRVSTLGGSASESLDTEPPAHRRGGWWWLLVILGTLSIAAGFVAGHRADREDGETVIASRGAAAPKPRPPTSSPSPTLEPRLPPMVTLRIDSNPSGAEVICGLVVVGLTPLVTTARASPGTAEIELRHPGFETKRIRIATDRDVHATVVLRSSSASNEAGRPSHL